MIGAVEIFHKLRSANRTTGRSEAMSHSVALKSVQCHTTGRSVRSRRQNEPQAQRRRQQQGQTKEARHAGRNLYAPTGSGSAGGQGSGQQPAVRPDHTAACEGVLDPRGDGPRLVICTDECGSCPDDQLTPRPLPPSSVPPIHREIKKAPAVPELQGDVHEKRLEIKVL